MGYSEQNKRVAIYSALGILSAVIIYAFISIKKQIDLAKQIKVFFADIKILPFTNKEVGLNVSLGLANKSSLNILIDVLNFDIYLNGIYINKIIQKTKQSVKSNATSFINFDVYVNPNKILGQLTVENILKGLDFKTIELKVQGYVDGSIDGISFQNFPIELSTKIGDMLPK